MDWENLDLNLCNVDFSDSNLIRELNLEPYPDLSTINSDQEKYDTIENFFTETINKVKSLDNERDIIFSKLHACEMDSHIYQDLKIDYIKTFYKLAILEHQREQAFEYLKNNKTN
ncbi:hypothetical protein [Acanthamoeba polyphaga mimivirus]|uniref:Uncharacterized protein n=1 Tax=Acanthamoeba polyphaga mimivirus TaxID=212035 RepID=A0A2L2DKI5_MIMIV|nr:hypothetical protein [Acanthamoeba polyphaga mimivirus]